MAEQKLLLGNVRGPQGAAGPNTVSSSTTTSGFENGQVLFNNNGKVGAKKLTASDVGALDAGGTAEKAKKLTKNGLDFEAWQLQMQDHAGNPYTWYVYGKYDDQIGGFALRSREEEGGLEWPVLAGKLQCKGSGGDYYGWGMDATFDMTTGKFHLLARQMGQSDIGILVDESRQVSSSSSIRYKEDIHTVEDELLDSVLGLDVIDFIYNSDAPEHVRDEKRHFGMIAEQVVKVMPDSVTLDREGLPAAVVYSDFIPLLLAQLKRQQKQIGALEQRIRQLEEGNRE